jgi:hypothetical protein
MIKSIQKKKKEEEKTTTTIKTNNFVPDRLDGFPD